MGTITWTCNLSNQKYWGSANQSYSLTGPSDWMPSGAKVTKLELEVYCGVSKYNKDVETSFTVYDLWGGSVDIEDWNNTGSSNRITIKASGTPDNQIEWDDLSYIELYGNTNLTLRDSEAILTITYQETELGYPTIKSVTQNDTSIKVSWDHVTYTGSATRKYNLLASAEGLWEGGYGTLGTGYMGTEATVTIDNNWRGKTLNLWLIAYADDYPTSKWSNSYSITIIGIIRYCYNGQWKECIPHYVQNGQWKQCIPYYGYNEAWKELI